MLMGEVTPTKVHPMPFKPINHLAHALLESDIDAVASNDEYVVFTVRIARETLRRNHSFLGDISEMAAGADVMPARITAAAMARSRQMQAVGAVTLLLAGFGLAAMTHGADALHISDLLLR